MKRIRVSKAAQRDMDDIWFYVAAASASLEIADGLIDSITEAFALFARAPGAGTRRDAILPGLRGCPVGNYIIYYAETKTHVVIARVLHGMREQQAAFRRQN